jgi:S1-C subfamily serine protease
MNKKPVPPKRRIVNLGNDLHTKKIIYFIIIVYIIALLLMFTTSDADTPQLNFDSSVTVETTATDGTRSIGSGVYVDKYKVITAAHCLVYKNLTVNGKPATVIKLIQKSDVAILQVTEPGTPAKIAKRYRVTDHVWTVSNPLGTLNNSVTDGVISSTLRFKDGIMMFQHSAPTSNGSSGGAIYNDQFELIGIVHGGADDGENLNFGIRITEGMLKL